MALEKNNARNYELLYYINGYFLLKSVWPYLNIWRRSFGQVTNNQDSVFIGFDLGKR